MPDTWHELAASHPGDKRGTEAYRRIMADVERLALNKQAEREALGITVEDYDAMTERDPQPVEAM